MPSSPFDEIEPMARSSVEGSAEAAVLVIAPGWPPAQLQRWQEVLGAGASVVDSVPATLSGPRETLQATPPHAVVMALRGCREDETALGQLTALADQPNFQATIVGVVVSESVSDRACPFPLLKQVRGVAHLVVATQDAQAVPEVAYALAWTGVDPQ